MPGKARRCFVCVAALLISAITASLAGGDDGVSRKGQDTAPDLTGRVVDPNGKPIPGVKIWTRQTEEESRRGAEPRPLAITGPDGTFSLRGLQPFPLVAVCPTGWVYESKQIMGFPPFQPIELHLRPATRISGRVVDKSGEPVAGVSVGAALDGERGGCIRHGALPPCLNGYEERSVITDSEGRFLFENLEPGWFAISVSEEAERPLVRRRGAAGRSTEGVEFVLSRKSVPVEGRVVDADGVPVAGASVTLSGALPSPETRTDAAGEFRFSEVLSGDNQLEVSHPDQGWLEQAVEIEDHPMRLDLRMPGATLVQGRILGPDGVPLKQVFLQDGERYLDVEPDGTFRFTAPPGEHEITGHSYEPEATTRKRFKAQGEPIDLELRLARTGTIKVRLTGLPPEEKGWIDLKDRPEGVSFGSEKGLYEIEDVPPGEWTLVASDANERSFERRVEVGEGETVTLGDIDFPPLPSIRGRVLDPAGRPSSQAIVTFVQGELEISAETDSAGSFVTWLREGSWMIRAEQQGFGPAVAAVEVSGDGPGKLPDLRLVRLVAVSGRVLGVDPDVVVPWVKAHSEDGLAERFSKVDQDNRFHLPDLWPGTWTLSTDIDGRQSSTTLRIQPEDTAVSINLDAEDEEDSLPANPEAAP